MKIIHVLNHFLPYQVAGTEVYVWALCKQLQKQQIDIEVLIPNYGSTETNEYECDGIKIHRFAEPSIVDRSLIMGKRIPDGVKYFAEYLSKSKPAIIHFHELAGSNGITQHHVKTAKESGAKVVMTFHLAGYSCRTGNLVYNEKELCDGKIDIYKCSKCYLHSTAPGVTGSLLLPASFLLYKSGIDVSKINNSIGTALGTVKLTRKFKHNFENLIELCDRVVVITEWYKKILILNGVAENKISYIAQGLPLEVSLQPIPVNYKVDAPIKLIFIGRLTPFKGLHLLIDAILQLPKDKIELNIYGQSGDSDYENELRNKTINNNNIHWNGKLKQNEVVTTMQQHDALCLCSTFSEMSPLVIQEAFAAGIPVIASNVYGNAEQIKHDNNGLLFQFKNVTSLKNQLERCLNEPDLLLQLKQNIQLPRSFSDVGNEYYNLYEQLFN